MNYQLLEDAILARLNDTLGVTGVDCKLLPENDADARQELNRSVTVVIDSVDMVDRLGDSTKSFTTLNSTTVQNGFVSISLLIKSRYLRGTEGIYNIKHQLDKYLVGYNIPISAGSYQGPIHAGEFARIAASEIDAGFHTYVYRLYVKELIVPVIEAETGPIAVNIDGVTSASDTPSEGILIANSDGSYTTTTTTDKVLPDISVIDFAGTVFAWPSVKNVNFAAGDLPDFDTGGSGPCAPATVTINSAAFDTVASGGAVDVPILDESGNQLTVEIVGNEVIINNGLLYLNGTNVDTLPPTANKLLTTTLDGAPVAATYSAGVIGVNSPAPSGIAYVNFVPAQRVNYEAGRVDTGANFAAGRYNRVQPSNPAAYARLDPADPTGKTMLNLNIHGNYQRFTDAAGNAGPFGYTATSNAGAVIVFQDHLHGGWWVGSSNTRTFVEAIDDVAALVVTGVAGTWLALDNDMVTSVQTLNGSTASNLLFDCGMTNGSYWTGMTRPDLVTQGYRMQSLTFGINAQAKTGTNRFIAFSYF